MNLKKIEHLYQNLNEKQFKYISILFCILGDLFSIFYITNSLNKETSIREYIRFSIGLNNIDYSEVSPEFIQGMVDMVKVTVSFVLSLYMLFNLIAYFRYYKNKQWAYKYVYGLSIFSVLLSFFVIIEAVIEFNWINFLNLVSIPLYLFVLIGMKYYFKSKEEQN